MNKILLILLIVAVGTLSLSIVTLNPSSLGNPEFQVMLGWLIFLVLLNWLITFSYFFSNADQANSNKIFGILPSVNLIVIFYSLASGPLIIFNYLSSSSFLEDYHLFLQIVLFGLMLMTVLLIQVASLGASSKNQDLPTKDDLILLIKKNLYGNIIQESTNLEISDKVKNLIDYVRYKMPHPSAIDPSKYVALIQKLNSLELYDDFKSEDVDIAVESIDKLLRSF